LVEEVKPKYAWVSSHTARRSFCTNECLAGTANDLIMAISGHRSEKAFRKYIKVDNLKKACMIKKLWDEWAGLSIAKNETIDRPGDRPKKNNHLI
jgi:hypothetical protein